MAIDRYTRPDWEEEPELFIVRGTNHSPASARHPSDNSLRNIRLISRTDSESLRTEQYATEAISILQPMLQAQLDGSARNNSIHQEAIYHRNSGMSDGFKQELENILIRATRDACQDRYSGRLICEALRSSKREQFSQLLPSMTNPLSSFDARLHELFAGFILESELLPARKRS